MFDSAGLIDLFKSAVNIILPALIGYAVWMHKNLFRIDKKVDKEVNKINMNIAENYAKIDKIDRLEESIYDKMLCQERKFNERLDRQENKIDKTNDKLDILIQSLIKKE